ncbi:MAG: type II toxin-antitoxin system VapC family toxin [Nitrospirae bacterium]|nr:type II toxin-antitoxin system VapC family toxin [Nitrospirota bacterium]
MRIVADSSVALKWWLDDEEFIEEAKLLLKKAIAGDIEIVVPELWYCEITNGIIVAVKRNRISEKQGLNFIEELRAIPVKQYQIAPYINKILAHRVREWVKQAAFMAGKA